MRPRWRVVFELNDGTLMEKYTVVDQLECELERAFDSQDVAYLSIDLSTAKVESRIDESQRVRSAKVVRIDG